MGDRMKVLLAASGGEARALVAALRARGMEVVTAADAVHALTMARDLRPDCMVVDARLPGGASGTLKRVRSNVYTADIPVIGIAADRAQGRNLEVDGARDVVLSPVDAARLAEAIQRHQLQDLDFTQAPAEALEAPARVQDLLETRLLDTPPDASFDRLTRLASRLLGAPVALVSLVDRDRQFFKSQVGLVEPWASARQTGLTHSFCQWVVSSNEPLVVSDATAHPVLRRNQAVKDLGVIAYAGVPLQGRAGEPIGAFCAIESKPRKWKDEDIDTLEDLARVTRAYAVLHQAKQQVGQSTGRAQALEISAVVAGHAIVGAQNILSRSADRLDPGARADLEAIISEQAQHLTRTA